MDKYIMVFLLSSMFILTACVSVASTEENPLNHPDDEMVTVLFSDSTSIQDENTYYDAFLTLQQHFEDEMLTFIIVDLNERDVIRYFEINEFPTMIVVTGENEHLRMEGILTEEEIITELFDLFLEEETP
ncbi:hypothetical protein [Halalkalibacter sp. APA_J-10(15)]|uniref:hypothetical protein n=1 Tax=unclassified Halalkalibacter TaxID=2893063 RepID=UPI001FF354FE|nr:hypothetical protein [Halalkalibacter sp. APA_J-10(15)]MCK0470593.1 hypothetical protein [Halalkalibacter sp. APA_J-10(15)]